MAIFTSILNWTQETFVPLGGIGLFIIAFMESSFFPVPPDLVLIPLVLLKPGDALWFALITTLGSAFGSILGYYIGKKGGRPILRKLISEMKIAKLDKIFEKHGVFAVGAAAFTPIPYKVFTISAGLFKLSLWKTFVVSFFCRGARFFPEAIILMIYGKQIVAFLTKYFDWISLIILVIAIIFYYYNYKKKKRARQVNLKN